MGKTSPGTTRASANRTAHSVRSTYSLARYLEAKRSKVFEKMSHMLVRLQFALILFYSCERKYKKTERTLTKV